MDERPSTSQEPLPLFAVIQAETPEAMQIDDERRELPLPSTPSKRAFAVALEVERTPSGTLKVTDEDVVLQKTPSSSIRPWRPSRLCAGEGVEVVDHLNPKNLFPAEDDTTPKQDGMNKLAQVLWDSGSEVDDDEFEDQVALEQGEEEIIPSEGLIEEPEAVEQPAVGVVNATYDWSADFSTFQAEREEFREVSGSKIEGTTPLDVFLQVWDQPLMEMIATHTNEYAWKHISEATDNGGEIPRNSRLHEWVETSVGELYRLIAIFILMSFCSHNTVDSYWTTGLLEMPKFRKLMSINRYLLLMRFLHFVDNQTLDAHGDDRKLAKIKPVLDYLNEKFASSYTPRREVSIDESLLLWKGRLSWRQCIRTKAARFGIKSYELCEAVTGYVIKIIIYTGKNTAMAPIFGFRSSTEKIVLHLFKDYLQKGYTLFMDNFYNFIALCRFLKMQKTDVVGTFNRKRVNLPADIKAVPNNAPLGTVVSRHCGDVSVVCWKDVKLVTMVSTYHKNNMVESRRAGEKRLKPEVTCTYNKYMGGVDLKDQKLSMYLMERKRGMKWYIKVFKRLLNTAILNSYIIYATNMGQQKKLTHRQFRSRLAEELCLRFGTDVSVVQTRSSNPVMRLDNSLGHYPEQIPVTGDRTKSQERYKRGRCTRCAAKKKRTQTSVKCSFCNVFLCIGPCWREFHTLD